MSGNSRLVLPMSSLKGANMTKRAILLSQIAASY